MATAILSPNGAACGGTDGTGMRSPRASLRLPISTSAGSRGETLGEAIADKPPAVDATSVGTGVSTNTCFDTDGTSPVGLGLLTNSMYGPGGVTAALGGAATVSEFALWLSTRNWTVRWSASTRCVIAGLRTSTTVPPAAI